jgi:hypothetical protein
MRTARNDRDVTTGSERRRIIWILLISFSLPVIAMLVAQHGQPQLGLVVLGVGLVAAALFGAIRRRLTREGTDERASDLHRRASSFSWFVTGLALTATLLWMYVRHGVTASEPYGYLLTVWLVSYVGAALWRRWRGF